MQLRLGDVLVNNRVLLPEQVARVLEEQRRTGEPFGLICERLFQVSPEAVEEAWRAQYVSIAQKVDPRLESFEERATELVSRRQAWQFRVLPIRFDGSELMLATTARHVRRALRFATKFLPVPVYLVIAEPEALGEMLCSRYPLPGMTPQSVDDDALDRLLAGARTAAA